MKDDEEKLKRAFEALKREDAKKAPSFRALVEKGPLKKRSPWVVLVPLTTVAAAAAVFVVWCNTTQMSSAPAPTAAGPRYATDEPPAAAPHAAGGKTAKADAVAAALADGTPRSDPAPLDFLLDLPGSSALAATSSFDALKELR